MNNLPQRYVDPARRLKESVARRLYRRSVVTGEITLPAAPGMLDEYVTMCAALFGGVGRSFTEEQLAHLRAVLEEQLAEAFAASPRSTIVISYNAPVGMTLNYLVRAQWLTVEGAYENWISTREPPLFGTVPDARVWAVATAAPDPRTYRVLDIGAGTGRNALALARRGHPVDVVESTPKFADMIRMEKRVIEIGPQPHANHVAILRLRVAIKINEVGRQLRQNRKTHRPVRRARRISDGRHRATFND